MNGQRTFLIIGGGIAAYKACELVLLQKTMVMVEGVATSLDPDLNMWETAGPFVGKWLRSDLVRRIEAAYPAPGAAPPPPPPLREVQVIRIGMGWRYLAVAVIATGAGAMLLLS